MSNRAKQSIWLAQQQKRKDLRDAMQTRVLDALPRLKPGQVETLRHNPILREQIEKQIAQLSARRDTTITLADLIRRAEMDGGEGIMQDGI